MLGSKKVFVLFLFLTFFCTSIFALPSKKKSKNAILAESISWLNKEKLETSVKNKTSSINSLSKVALSPSVNSVIDRLVSNQIDKTVLEKRKDFFQDILIKKMSSNSKIKRKEIRKEQTYLKLISIDLVNHKQEKNSQADLDIIGNDHPSVVRNIDGSFKISHKLKQSGGSTFVTAISKWHIRSNMFLNLNSKRSDLFSLTSRSVSYIADKYNIKYIGAILLVKKNNFSYIDIDSNYKKQIYFDSRFNIVKKSENASFILFLGLNSGNKTLRYLTKDNLIATKVIHLIEDEMFYDNSYITEDSDQTVELFEKSLLSKDMKRLVINTSEISYYNTSLESIFNGGNSYELYIPPKPKGSRKYFKFSHLPADIYYGNYNDHLIELPDYNVLKYFFSKMNINKLQGRCLVEVDIDKALDFEISSNSEGDPISFQEYYFDRDGEFSLSFSEMASKVFILGEQEGLLNIKVKYKENDDYIISYCLKNTYLIENLIN